jgi:hypothetical protein
MMHSFCLIDIAKGLAAQVAAEQRVADASHVRVSDDLSRSYGVGLPRIGGLSRSSSWALYLRRRRRRRDMLITLGYQPLDDRINVILGPSDRPASLAEFAPNPNGRLDLAGRHHAVKR